MTTENDGPHEQLPERLAAKVAGLLEADEKVLWVGQPGRHLPMPARSWRRILYFFVAGAILTALALRAEGVLRIVLGVAAGLCWLLTAFGLMLPTIWRSGWIQRNCYYLITDRRALISYSKPYEREAKVKSYLPAALTGLTCVEREDGSGDLLFEGDAPGQRRLSQGFITIERVREVEQTLRQALHL